MTENDTKTEYLTKDLCYSTITGKVTLLNTFNISLVVRVDIRYPFYKVWSTIAVISYGRVFHLKSVCQRL